MYQKVYEKVYDQDCTCVTKSGCVRVYKQRTQGNNLQQVITKEGIKISIGEGWDG